ncbi:hypothetical protein [Archangium lansingense]|uniref:Uncharacterized protein n=1 Tax=Archangium lansingense TaxID=2995310 RepID=A0ABT4AED6_9BACT|nr:hypothetical protein [Archangium lansinium]MCY1080015.1 hypothetical protein [Archangium lansinium]
MSIYDSLIGAGQFAASRWRNAGFENRKEEQRLWAQMNVYRDFIYATGQVYLFEDYLKGLPPTSRPYMSNALAAHQDAATSQRSVELLLKAYAETTDPEQHQSASVLVHLVNFIADTGQLDACEDYINNRLDYAPLAIAHFTTRDEAEAWLKGPAEPPSPANILIGDEYYQAVYSREDNTRFMYRDYIIEQYIGELAARGIPPTAPSFETRAEAEAWLKDHPATPFDFASIAGEYYFAVHHKRLKRHTLHHVASALAKWEEMKRAAEQEKAQDAAAKTEREDE